MAYEFAQRGAHLILSARSLPRLESVKSRCETLGSPSVSIVALDLSDLEQTLAIGKSVSTQEQIDILVHSAGLGQRTLVLETCNDIDVESRLLQVNTLGPIALTKGVLPSMIARNGGHVVGINSVQGLMGVPMRAAYSASKFALKFFLWSVRAEMHSAHIRTTNIYPGYVRTSFSSNALSASGDSTGILDESFHSGMPVDEFARKAVRAIYWQEKDVLICQFKFKIAAFLQTFCPWVLRKLQVKYMKRQLRARENAKKEK